VLSNDDLSPEQEIDVIMAYLREQP
jgi:hypothetical protein